MNKTFQILSSEAFVEEHINDEGKGLNFKNSPIQIYPLSQTSKIINIPTPLFRAQYNFLLIFSAGGGIQQVDNEFIKLGPKDVLFIREGHLNAVQAIDPDSQGYFIYIENALIPNLFPSRSQLNQLSFSPKISVDEKDIKWLNSCGDLLYQLKDSSSTDLEVKCALLKAMILKLLSSYQIKKSATDRSTEVTFLFKELLYSNFKEKRDVRSYAASLSITENYLNRCVKHVTDKSPKQHINEVVIFHSQTLLQNLSKDISQIAFDLHFSDPAYFGRLFKQITGTTPSAYRNKFSHDLSE